MTESNVVQFPIKDPLEEQIARMMAQLLRQRAFTEPFRRFVEQHVRDAIRRLGKISAAVPIQIRPELEGLTREQRAALDAIVRDAVQEAGMQVRNRLLAHLIGEVYLRASLAFQAQELGFELRPLKDS